MKKNIFRALSLVMAITLIVCSFAGCAKINYVTDGAVKAINEVKDGSWKETDDTAATGDVDKNKLEIDEFAANTYGGVEFASVEDVVKYYNEAYDYTKGLTAQYKDKDGNTATWYKLLGEEKLSVSNIMIEGKENSMINNLVPGIVDGIYSPALNGLQPCANRTPADDIDENNESLLTSRLVADDLVTANVKDNGDGTITIVLQPKATEMSHKGLDEQGHVFSSLGAIDEVVDQISVLSWSSGTTAENCLVSYYGGTATFTIDTKTKEITAAEYIMYAHVSVTHACVTVIKDKSAQLLVTYDVKYPASDKYLMDTKECSRL